MRARRAAEQLSEDAVARINELTTINVNLSSTRAKLEQELSAYAADFEEASKELKVHILAIRPTRLLKTFTLIFTVLYLFLHII